MSDAERALLDLDPQAECFFLAVRLSSTCSSFKYSCYIVRLLTRTNTLAQHLLSLKHISSSSTCMYRLPFVKPRADVIIIVVIGRDILAANLRHVGFLVLAASKNALLGKTVL